MVSSIVIYLRLSCVVIVLFKQVSLFSALNSWEIATCIVVSRLWWDNRRHCGITSRRVYNPSLEGLRIHLNNLCPQLDQVRIVGFVVRRSYLIFHLDSSKQHFFFRLLGSLTPEPLFVNNPILPLHRTLTPVSLCTLYCLTQMSLSLMSTYPWCQKVPTFALAQPLSFYLTPDPVRSLGTSLGDGFLTLWTDRQVTSFIPAPKISDPVVRSLMSCL